MSIPQCSSCGGVVRERARYCSHCGIWLNREDPTYNALSVYHSRLRETTYLEPEWQAKAEAALKQPPTGRLKATAANPVSFGRPRNIVLVLLLPLLTLGFYALYWWWATGHEIRDYLQSKEPQPGRDLLLLPLTCGLWRLYMHYSYAVCIADMQERVQLPRNEHLKIICPLLSFFFLGFISIALLQYELNRIWEAEGL
ncbi:MAG: DUF4234 domain-containing protein [Acidobacteriota bacterium]